MTDLQNAHTAAASAHLDVHGHGGHGGHAGHGLAHVASKGSLLLTFGVLLFFTYITVWVAQHPLGAIDIWVAMIIATIKATFVALFFMHLRHDRPFNTLLFLSSFLFVTIFIATTLMDRGQYDRQIDWKETLPAFQDKGP